MRGLISVQLGFAEYRFVLKPSSISLGRGSENRMNPNMPAAFREYMTLERARSGEQEISVAEYQRWLQLKRVLNRHFQPGVQDSHEDRRESVRVPARLRAAFQSNGEIRESLMQNISRGGLFISTTEPLPLGTKVEIRVHTEESGENIDVKAEVASHIAGPGLMNEDLGMGVRFIELNESQAKAIDELYEHSLRRAIKP